MKGRGSLRALPVPAVGAREPRLAKEGAEGGPAGFPAFPPACLGTGMGEARITHVSFPNLDYILGKSPAFLSVALVLSRTFNAVGMWLRPEGMRDLGAGPYCHERTGVSGESGCFSPLSSSVLLPSHPFSTMGDSGKILVFSQTG